VAVLLLVLGTIESNTADRKYEEFSRRTASILGGLTEAQVRAAAGAPDHFVSDIRSLTDPDAAGASCARANATAAMLYSFVTCGWLCEHLGLPSGGSITEVLCLDDRRVVVHRYLEMMHH
jgi:hypothetical protein